jgi:hypothetical protein
MSESHETRLLGTWQLEVYQVLVGGESRPSILGERPVGLLAYNPDGYMSAIMAAQGRQPTGAPSLLAAADPDALAAARSLISYAGRFQVIGENVHHHVMHSLLPDWVGQTLVRTISWQADRLTLAPPDDLTSSGKTIQRAITWSRVTSPSD